MTRHLSIALLALLGAMLTPGIQAQSPAASGQPPAWHSALDGYQPFSEEKTTPWREANETVQSVGGWRAYAREAAQAASAPASTPKASRGIR